VGAKKLRGFVLAAAALVACLGVVGSSVGARKTSGDRHFVGTLTLEEHRVWDYKSSFVDEHGVRTLTGRVKVDLTVNAGGSVVKTKLSGASLTGGTHLLEQIHPGSCSITDKASLAPGVVSVGGSLSELTTSWPWDDKQVDVGTCSGEPSGAIDRVFAWTPSCTTKGDGRNGSITYSSSFQPPFGTGGVGSLTTYSCHGTLIAGGGASVSVGLLVGKKVAVGDTVAAKVKVTAGSEDLTNVDLGAGLKSSDEAKITQRPDGLSGFDLSAGTSRTFSFTLKGAKSGTATLTARVSADSKSSGGVEDSATAQLKVGETLSVDWTMPQRLDPDNSSWPGPEGLPPAKYVSPDDWTVNLFLTDGTGKVCPSGVTWEWKVTGGGKTDTLDSNRCTAQAKVAKLGEYNVKAIQLKDASPTGVEAANDHVVVKDWLVVGLGDSNGSGQGNPPYINKQCDRSVVSYQYQTALYLEKHDPRSSVTFVFDSCSGARSDQVWQNSYEGQEPGEGVELPPQLDQVKGVIGKRKPDAVIMSVGINDLFFGSIMGFCTTYIANTSNTHGHVPETPDCEIQHVTPDVDAKGYTTGYNYSKDAGDGTVAARTAGRLAVLPNRLALLDKHLTSLDAAHIFASQYPDETTDAKGLCNGTGPFPKLSSGVWGWLQQTGTGLNNVVAGTSSLGWIPITGVAAGFIGHGYCSPDSYFDTPLKSQWEQKNLYGSFHATAKGAAITFGLTRAKVCQALYGNPDCDGEPPASK